MRSLTGVVVVLGLLLSCSCGGGGNNGTPPPVSVSITLTPSSANVIAGATQQFTATVSGSANTAVTWTVSGGGTVSSSGLYTAPSSLTTPATVTVKATAQADTSKSKSASVTIPAISATISPTTPSVILGATQLFTANVSNATDTSVTWSISTGAGAVDASGRYSAPSSFSTPSSATVSATPNADPSKAVSTTLTIPGVGVTISPTSTTLNAGTAEQFTASVSNATNNAVTWSLTGNGTLDTHGHYAAPNTVSSPATVTVTATAVADTGKSNSATIQLNVISLGVAGYVVMPDGQFKTLSVHSIDSATGKLRPAGLTFVSPDMYTNPDILAVHPNGKFIYTDAGFIGFLGYSLDSDGDLSPIPGSPFSAPSCRPLAMDITPNGQFLYVINDYGSMWGYTIDQSSGVLTALSGSPWSTGVTGRALAFDPASKYLYAMNEGGYQDSTIVVFSISPTGQLTQLQSILAPGTGFTSGMGITPNGKFLYATGFMNGVVDGFTIDPVNGLLTFIPGSPFTGGGYPGEGLAVDPLGKYVYAGNRFGIAMYTINNTTGVLTEVAGSPFLNGYAESSDFHPDSTGNFLYTNQDFALTAIKVDRAHDQLTFLNSIHSRTQVGTGRWARFGLVKSPTSVSVANRFAYVLNNQDHTISRYTVDATNGALVTVGSAVTTGGTNPVAMSTDMYGNFLFAVNKDTNTVAAFTINPTTGALTKVTGSPFATGQAPTGVAVEATGRVLYVGTSGDDSISAYSINSLTGVLTLLGSVPTGQCVGARSLFADWRGTTLYQTCPTSKTTAIYSLQPETGLLWSTTPTVVPYGGPSLALSPYGAAPPYTNLVYWHSFGFLVSPTDQVIDQFIVGNLGELVLTSSGNLGPTQAVAVDPLGRFVYGANTNANNVQANTIDPADGTLTQVVGSPWGTGTFPIATVVDPTARFLYVVNRDSNTVSGYVINQATGDLTPMSTPTFGTGNKPVAMVVMGSID
ncbi:MAG: beta-propeller fold lactonase family protein [Acidobacteriia bacterium]|nr:beta-propeller fold lactonase family protein [Terriglobia bacterium]